MPCDHHYTFYGPSTVPITLYKALDLIFTTIFLFPCGSDGKESACNAGALDLIPGLGRSLEGNGNPLQYSCLENSMNRGAWWAIVHGVENSLTRLSDYTFTFIIFLD